MRAKLSSRPLPAHDQRFYSAMPEHSWWTHRCFSFNQVPGRLLASILSAAARAMLAHLRDPQVLFVEVGVWRAPLLCRARVHLLALIAVPLRGPS